MQAAMVAKAVYSFYQLRKSKKFLHRYHLLYRKQEKILTPHAKEKILLLLRNLQEAIANKSVAEAILASQGLAMLKEEHLKQNFWKRVFSSALTFIAVFSVVIVVRTMGFEPYRIPTGSMRPTLKESDYLVVTKSDFGLNVPLKTSHFYFDPDLVQRGAITVFTSENLDAPDSDTMNFWIFPGKKMFVKRLIGKPGDSLYFYGGKIYGVDAKGNALVELRNSSWASSLEHIPFLSFEGRMKISGSTATFHQMNEPVATLSANAFGLASGKMLSSLKEYSDLWGMKNYAMARLLTEEQLRQIHPHMKAYADKGVLYLELIHHPSITSGQILRDEKHRTHFGLGKSVSILPLQQTHLDQIANSMTTCRFTVEDGVAFRLGMSKKDPFYSKYFPVLRDVPNGTYEIQNGKVYKVYPLGFTKEVKKDHPLYRKDPISVQLLYNLGIEFLTQYQPGKYSFPPSRYAYFRDGDLYLLNAPVIAKEDPALIEFAKEEASRQSLSTSLHPYFPFKDEGAPLKQDGSLDVDFIRTYGLTVPEKHYLMLGDNHAMSGDSRQFGFVPEENLKGCVALLLSPLGERAGLLPQPRNSLMSFPMLFVLGVTFLYTASYVFYKRKRSLKNLFSLQTGSQSQL